MERNSATKWRVFAYGTLDHGSPGEPVTGDAANITAALIQDGGGSISTTDTNPVEEGLGYYLFDISPTENNFSHISISPETSTPNVRVIGVPGAVYTTGNTSSNQVPSVVASKETFFVTTGERLSNRTIKSIKGEDLPVAFDFSPWAEDHENLSSVSWVVESGSVSIDNESLANNVATASLTTNQTGISKITITGISASYTKKVYLTIKTESGFPSSDY